MDWRKNRTICIKDIGNINLNINIKKDFANIDQTGLEPGTIAMLSSRPTGTPFGDLTMSPTLYYTKYNIVIIIKKSSFGTLPLSFIKKYFLN